MATCHPRFGLTFLIVVALIAVTAANVPRTRKDADQMVQKITVITTNGMSARPVSRRTTVTEGELNSFLAFHARHDMPAGVLEPTVTIGPAGKLTGTAIVDLDAVRKSKSSEGFSATSLLTGRLPVQASGVLHTKNGIGRFELQEAWVSSLPVPKTLLQEIVSHYTRTPAAPQGINLEAPFELPVAIREIRTVKGEAVVVQ